MHNRSFSGFKSLAARLRFASHELRGRRLVQWVDFLEHTAVDTRQRKFRECRRGWVCAGSLCLGALDMNEGTTPYRFLWYYNYNVVFNRACYPLPEDHVAVCGSGGMTPADVGRE